MSIAIRRKVIVPAWFLLFALLVLFGTPMTFPSGVFVLLIGTVVLTILLVLTKPPSQTIAEVVHDAEISRTV